MDMELQSELESPGVSVLSEVKAYPSGTDGEASYIYSVLQKTSHFII